MASDDPDLVTKLKQALRQVGYRKDGVMEVKNEAVLQTETLDDNEPEEAAEDAYYGYQNQGRNRNQNPRNQGQGYQNQGQGYQNQGQGQSRQWIQPANNNQLVNNQTGYRQK